MLNPEIRGVMAQISREEFECHLDFIELHACPECNTWIAQCRKCNDGLYCPECKVEF